MTLFINIALIWPDLAQIYREFPDAFFHENLNFSLDRFNFKFQFFYFILLSTRHNKQFI